MSHTLAKLLCVAALGALAVPVYAQTPQADVKSTEAAQAPTSPTAAGAPAAISAEEKAARAACESKPSGEKEKCLKDLDAKYGKTTMPDKMAPSTDKMAPSGDMATKPKEDTTKSGSYK